MSKCNDDSLYCLLENKGGACGDLIWDNSTYLIGSGPNESIRVKPLPQCPAHNKQDVSVKKHGQGPSKFVKEEF